METQSDSLQKLGFRLDNERNPDMDMFEQLLQQAKNAGVLPFREKVQTLELTEEDIYHHAPDRYVSTIGYKFGETIVYRKEF